MGKGRPPKARGIAAIRELTPEDLAKLKAGQPGTVPAVQSLRDSHHRVARLVAAGLRLQDIGAMTGYSMVRIYTLNSTPAFQELVAKYRNEVDKDFLEEQDEYYRLIRVNAIKAERQIGDRLDEADESPENRLPIRELTSISRDAADRIGYGKNSVQVNLNADFATVMEKRKQLSRQVIEGTAVDLIPQPTPSVQRESPPLVPSPKRRI